MDENVGGRLRGKALFMTMVNTTSAFRGANVAIF